MSSSTTSGARRSRQNALKAACLTASLATAFGSAPAQAVTPASGLQAVNGSQSTPIYDGYLLNASPAIGQTAVGAALPDATSLLTGGIFSDSVTPVPASFSAPSGADSVLVFTAASEAASLSGQSFESAFLSENYFLGTPSPATTAYTEAEVANYITGGSSDTNPNDQSAYQEFIDNLYYKYYSSPNQTGTISAYAFTNGQYAGVVNPSQLPAGYSPNTGFGLTNAQPAVPEPGSLPLLMAGGLVLAGLTVARRRHGLRD